MRTGTTQVYPKAKARRRLSAATPATSHRSRGCVGRRCTRSARQDRGGRRNEQALTTAANDAVALNSFGEHYLQDSYAAGHLINKGFIMAVAMEHSSAATKKIRGLTGAKNPARPRHPRPP